MHSRLPWELGGLLTIIEFAYNNSYHASIDMAPYEALYGRPYRLPLCLADYEELVTLGLGMIQETTKKLKMIQKKDS